MDVQELQSPDDYMPTPSVRYNVLRVEPHADGWAVQSGEVRWDEYGIEFSAPPHDQVLDTKHLDRLKLIWHAQGFVLAAQYKSDAVEVSFYEHHADRQKVEAQSSAVLPQSLEVWICPNREMAFKCELPKTIAFSVRSAHDLKQHDIGATEVQVSEARGSITAKVYWLNGQPSDEAQARWEPVIQHKVREYVQSSLSQSSRVFVKGIIEDSVRQGKDARDLIVAGVDLKARLAQLKALDYQPMAKNER
jgi:hypothetical protein